MVASLAQTQLLEQKDQQIAELTRQLASAQHQLKILQHQVEQLLRRIYGRRSEKLDPNQLMFDNLILQAADQPVEAVNEEPEDEPDPPRRRKRNNKNHPGRIPIPDHLERVEIILDIPEEEKFCPETTKPWKASGQRLQTTQVCLAGQHGLWGGWDYHCPHARPSHFKVQGGCGASFSYYCQ
jgi:hypothetical protein